MKLSPSLAVRLLLPCLLAGLSACHRAPQTAKQLFDRLPRHWQGDAHLQGGTDTHKINIELRQLTVRDEHTLEFNRVHYQVLVGNEVAAEEDAAIRGTITAPGGEVRLEQEGTEAGDALKPGTFQGKVSDDLQSAEASWTTGLGQSATLKLKAAP